MFGEAKMKDEAPHLMSVCEGLVIKVNSPDSDKARERQSYKDGKGLQIEGLGSAVPVNGQERAKNAARKLRETGIGTDSLSFRNARAQGTGLDSSCDVPGRLRSSGQLPKTHRRT